ncbi:hypothetical protein AURDEDRAFT_185836 [Auricularia subglabra TFB-10046 SS5]|nr:hypothetical protein AURDEDRAFT_185836 [Auricularia subglabra TFB-10046 SS5]
MASIHSPQWIVVYERAASVMNKALDPQETRGQRVQRLLDETSSRGAVNAALADALERWNSAHPNALQRLPTELVHAIFRLLAFRDRIAVSHVSRGWRTTALADPFLWNAFAVKGSWNPRVWYPPPGRPHKKPPPRPPPPRKADILRELLVRSDPAPFALAWENRRPPRLPDEVAELVLQHMHRMQELTVDLSARAFERLFALPAPMLRTLSCTADSAPCTLPARWDAPVLQKLELGKVRVGEMQPLPTVEVFICYELRGLEQDLFTLLPALTSLYIGATTPEVVRCLGEPPASLVELTLRTDGATAIDYAPLLSAYQACNLELLRLESARDIGSALELFTELVATTWSMKINSANRQVEVEADDDAARFEVHLAERLSLEREPRIARHLARASSLSANAAVLAQLDGLEAWDRSLPALRELTLEVTGQLHWPVHGLGPIRVPMLENVSVVLDTMAEGAALWVTRKFPSLLRSRFAYDRPLLEVVSIKADSDAARELEEDNLASLRAIADCVRVEAGSETNEYAHNSLGAPT